MWFLQWSHTYSAPLLLFYSSRTIQLSLSTLLRTETLDELSTASVCYASCQWCTLCTWWCMHGVYTDIDWTINLTIIETPSLPNVQMNSPSAENNCMWWLHTLHHYWPHHVDSQSTLVLYPQLPNMTWVHQNMCGALVGYQQWTHYLMGKLADWRIYT